MIIVQPTQNFQPKMNESITNDRETMKMFHRSHIAASTIRLDKQAHHDDAKTMETLHRLTQAPQYI